MKNQTEQQGVKKLTPSVSSGEWKKMMVEMKHQYLKEQAPSFYEASGGRTMIVKAYNDNTSNGLTNAIMDFLKFKSHYANRINVIGVSRNIGGIQKYTPSSTRKGTADLFCLILGKHVSLEIKCKATNDRMSDAQKREKIAIEANGGLFYVAVDFPSFYNWYQQTFHN